MLKNLILTSILVFGTLSVWDGTCTNGHVYTHRGTQPTMKVCIKHLSGGKLCKGKIIWIKRDK